MVNHDIESFTEEKDTGSMDVKSTKGEVSREPYNRTGTGKTSPSTTTASDHDLETFPEGGLEAWSVVIGSWAAMTASMVCKRRRVQRARCQITTHMSFLYLSLHLLHENDIANCNSFGYLGAVECIRDISRLDIHSSIILILFLFRRLDLFYFSFLPLLCWRTDRSSV